MAAIRLACAPCVGRALGSDCPCTGRSRHLPVSSNPGPPWPFLATGQAEGLEFLTTRPPWKCTICNVTCTSQDTLMGHAAGAKHKRRVRFLAGLGQTAVHNGGECKGRRTGRDCYLVQLCISDRWAAGLRL